MKLPRLQVPATGPHVRQCCTGTQAAHTHLCETPRCRPGQAAPRSRSRQSRGLTAAGAGAGAARRCPQRRPAAICKSSISAAARASAVASALTELSRAAAEGQDSTQAAAAGYPVSRGPAPGMSAGRHMQAGERTRQSCMAAQQGSHLNIMGGGPKRRCLACVPGLGAPSAEALPDDGPASA